MTHASDVTAQLDAAVLQNPALNQTGALERLFARLFEGLVYPQIWEDPVADMEALKLQAGEDVFCIASGGCNAMSYLTARPASVTAVDLSPAHVALVRLKVAAAQHLDQPEFFEFFARADTPRNVARFDTRILPHLDTQTAAYWQTRVRGRRRIEMFARGFYRHGVLGRFIGSVHLVAKLARVDFRPLLAAQTLADQQAFFDRAIAPLFENRFVRFLARRRASLFGLGIPPAQYDKLAADGGGDVVPVLRERTRKLVCDFPVRDNYFLWQAFHRAYAPDIAPSVPPYLEAAQFPTIAETASRLRVHNRPMTDLLGGRDAASLDAYVLLDAQDWMTDAQLTALWTQITRTARPGARVLFRTGGADDILPGRVPDAILSRWRYDADASARAFAADRSAIYGGVHLYHFKG
jgi:S-adenosylmethionine-diacylglycerol 3-amino-3-carboxypropyl transferase